MAQNLLATILAIIFLSVTLSTLSTQASPKYNFRTMRETRMVLYMHDLETGRNVTTFPVAGLRNKRWGTVQFGSVFAVDDKLTEAYEWDSPQAGRARGIYVSSALDGSDLHLLMSLVFTSREYNGSTLEIQGADRDFQKYREVSVVSGTGKFRLARGFAVLETVFLDVPNLNAVLRWNLTVFHY